MKHPILQLDLIEWAVAQRALPGQGVSGDLHLVAPCSHGVLVAAIDGVGHGPEATLAAERAVRTMSDKPDDSVHSLFNRCHTALKNTRGVVATLAVFNALDNTLTWAGVGNVEGRLYRADEAISPPIESVLLRGGVVGAKLPSIYAGVLPLNHGDLLVLATDGIRIEFEAGVQASVSPQTIVDQVLVRHFKGTDDALVMAVRYLGARP